MNYIINNPKRIDKEIQFIQTQIYEKVGWSNIDIYGRVHKNPHKTKGLIPEFYLGDNEYKEVFQNDVKNATIFFIDDNLATVQDGNNLLKSKIKIVCFVNLEKCFEGITHRADTESELHLLKIVKNCRMFELTGIEKGIGTIFREFNTTGIEKTNMQPMHVFALVGELKYKINEC